MFNTTLNVLSPNSCEIKGARPKYYQDLALKELAVSNKLNLISFSYTSGQLHLPEPRVRCAQIPPLRFHGTVPSLHSHSIFPRRADRGGFISEATVSHQPRNSLSHQTPRTAHARLLLASNAAGPDLPLHKASCTKGCCLKGFPSLPALPEVPLGFNHYSGILEGGTFVERYLWKITLGCDSGKSWPGYLGMFKYLF